MSVTLHGKGDVCMWQISRSWDGHQPVVFKGALNIIRRVLIKTNNKTKERNRCDDGKQNYEWFQERIMSQGVQAASRS